MSEPTRNASADPGAMSSAILDEPTTTIPAPKPLTVPAVTKPIITETGENSSYSAHVVIPQAESSIDPKATDPTPAPKGIVDDGTPEPQSTLTKRFTEAEWEALKIFRADLPEIFSDGFPDNPKAKDTPVTMWGIQIDPRNPKDARVSVVLMKFLRARHLSIRDARDMLVSTLRWRDMFKVDEALAEKFPADIFGELAYIRRDKVGRPVVYNFYGRGNIREVFSDVQRFLRWRVALQERSIALLDFEEIDQIIQIHDYEGVSILSSDKNSKNAASEATSIFQGHYPEFLYKKFFVNVPTVLTWMFSLFKPLLSAETVAKMSVVGHGHRSIQNTLLPYIPTKEIPECYGGEAGEP